MGKCSVILYVDGQAVTLTKPTVSTAISHHGGKRMETTTLIRISMDIKNTLKEKEYHQGQLKNINAYLRNLTKLVSKMSEDDKKWIKRYLEE